MKNLLWTGWERIDVFGLLGVGFLVDNVGGGIHGLALENLGCDLLLLKDGFQTGLNLFGRCVCGDTFDKYVL